jgi:hypothetical protein
LSISLSKFTVFLQEGISATAGCDRLAGCIVPRNIAFEIRSGISFALPAITNAIPEAVWSR